jgi:hypothetical protein
LDELMNLLGQLGSGAAAQPLYDMIMDLDTESMDMPQLEQAIRTLLTLHGCEACADAVISALAEVDFAGLKKQGPRAQRTVGWT